MKEKYGDERRSKIINHNQENSDEEPIPEKVLSNSAYARITSSEP